MRSIYKYKLDLDSRLQYVEAPSGWTVLHVAMQDDTPCLWALVHHDRPAERHLVMIAGTGHQIGDAPEGFAWSHCGTFLMCDGLYVWHVFEAVKV